MNAEFCKFYEVPTRPRARAETAVTDRRQQASIRALRQYRVAEDGKLMDDRFQMTRL